MKYIFSNTIVFGLTQQELQTVTFIGQSLDL